METSNFHKCIPGWLQGITVWHIYIYFQYQIYTNIYTYSKIQNDVHFFYGIKSKHPLFGPKLAPWKLHPLPRGNRQPRPVRPAGVRWLPDAQSIESEERRLCWDGRGNWELHKTEKLTWIYPKSWFRKGDSLWNMAFLLVRLLDFWGEKTCFIFGRELPCWNEMSVFFLGSTCRLLGVGQAPHVVNTTF